MPMAKLQKTNAKPEFSLEWQHDGCFLLSGKMTFGTVGQILQESIRLFGRYSNIEVDLSGVTDTDSAGLALLLEWITWANHTMHEIRFENLPEKIDAIAKTTEVEELLSCGERWSGFIETTVLTEGA